MKKASKLSESELRYKYLFESMPQGVVYQDKTGAIIEANEAALQTLGLTYDQLCGKTSYDPEWKAIKEDGSDFLGETHPSVVALKTGLPVKNTIMGVFNRKENNYKWININSFPIFSDTSKEPTEVFTTFDDITERKEAEKQLKENELKYKNQVNFLDSIIENSPFAMWIADPNGYLVRVNQVLRDTLEIPADLDITQYNILEDENFSNQGLTYILDDVFKNHKSSRFEMFWLGAETGEDNLSIPKKLWVFGSMYPIIDQSGKLINVIFQYVDITERKEAEQQLKESEEKFFKIFQSSPNAILLSRLSDYKILNVNASIQAITGYTSEEVIGKKHSQFNIWKSEDEREIFTDKMIKNGRVKDFEAEFIHKSGEIRIWRTSGEIIEIRGEKYVLGIISDVTALREAEIELKESEEKFFKIFQSSPNSIILTRLSNFEIVNANEATLHITGYALDDIIGKAQSELDVWKSADERILFGEQLSKNGKVKDFEAEFVTKSGEDRIWKTSGEIVQISNEKYILGIIEDVTELRLAELELKRQSEFIHTMTENQPAGIVACDADGKLALFNKAAKEWHGIDILKISQEQWAENYGLYKEDGKTILKMDDIPLMKAFKGEKVDKYEMVIKAVGQTPRLVTCSGASFFDKSGKRLGAVVVMNDITKQRIIENNLKKSEELTRRALDEVERSELFLNETGKLSKIGGWELDLTTMTPYFSEETYRIYEIPNGEPPKLEDGILFYPLEARELVQKAVSDAIEKHINYDIEVPFITAKGKHIWVRTIGQVQVKNGTAVRLFGTIQDITNLKKTQLEIQNTNDLLEAVTNNLPGAVIQYKINSDGSDALTYVSSGSNEIWGIKPEDAMRDNQHIWNQIDKNYIDQVKESINESYVNLNNWHVEFKSKLPNGKTKWIQGIGTPKKHDDGSVIWNSIMLDVSHRKEAEKNIKSYQESLKKLTIDLSLAEEKQRKDIAANIHDHLSQSLVISKMKLRDYIKVNSISRDIQELNTVIQHLSDAIENSRKITYDLSPPILYELGLIETMYWLAEKTQKEHGLKVSFVTNQEYIKLSEKELILIFRTIQELINNTIKHAKATYLEIKFNIQTSLFEILIVDDGVGFDLDLGFKIGKKNSGFGLFSVKERIQNLFGAIDFDTAIGKGTCVKIAFPLDSSFRIDMP